MLLILRGAIHLGLYLVVLVWPLLLGGVFRPSDASPSFTINLAVALGYVGFAIMTVELVLVSRVQGASSAFGLDVLQQFHKEIGVAAFCFVLAHPLLLLVGGYPARILVLSPGVPWAVALGTVALLLTATLIALSIWRKRLKLRYEVWQAGHGLLTITLLLAAGVHIVGVGRFVRVAPMAILWALCLLPLIIRYGMYRVVMPLRLMKKPWRVVENRAEAGDAHTLRLEPVGHGGWEKGFQAGQFGWLNLRLSPFGYGLHPISLSSNGDAAAETGAIEFTIKNLGDWSGQVVPNARPGDRVWVDGPYGVFTLDREQGPGYVFLAGGVGITPLHSMLLTMAERGDVRPVVLVYGTRHVEDLTFRDELLALGQRMNLKVVFVVSEPPPGWEGETGFITAELLMRYLPSKQYRRWQYFVCGPGPMMDAMEKTLPGMGVPTTQIHTERFDMV